MTVLPQPGLVPTIATFAVVIGVLVFVHEMGHYLVARWFGIKADTFSIGFGREIAGWTDRRGTRWKLGVLPLGGYVKFAGDADAASRPDADAGTATPAERAVMFQFRPMAQRAAVIAAGPMTNFAFAVLVFTGLHLAEGRWTVPAVVGRVAAGSPAERAGLRPGDRIATIDGRDVAGFDDVVAAVGGSGDRSLAAVVVRGEGRFTAMLTPGMIATTDATGKVTRHRGIGILSGRPVHEPCGPVAAATTAVGDVAQMIGLIARSLGEVVTGHRAATDLGGPIKIAQISGQAAALGLPNLIEFIAFVSINLGFINLLPVPLLDGGHLFLYAVEAVRRRPLAPRVQEWAFMSGFAALMSLMVFLTWNDLAGIGAWHRLSGLFG